MNICSSVVIVIIASTLLTAADAGFPKPSLSISVSNGDYDGVVDGLKPTLKWSGSSSVSNSTDMEYGLETADEILGVPKTVFGTLKTRLGGWGVSAGVSRKEVGTSIGLKAVHVNADLSAEVAATSEGGVQSLSASKGFSSFQISPKYSFGSGGGASLVVGYDNDEKTTSVKLTASADDQTVVLNKSVGSGATDIQLTASASSPVSSAEVVIDQSIETTGTDITLTASQSLQQVTLRQRIDEDNVVAHTWNSDRDLSVVWERSLGGDNSVTTTFRPDRSIDVEWKDDGWTAHLSAGLNGTSIEGITVSTKRKVVF